MKNNSTKTIKDRKETKRSVKAFFHTSSFAIILLSFMIFLSGCKKIDHPIAGKTFYYSFVYQSGVHYTHTYITFFENGKYCERTKSRNHYDTSDETFDHLKWEVDGNNITIRLDNSTEWKPSARGKVWKTGYYNPSDNCVILDNIRYEYLY